MVVTIRPKYTVNILKILINNRDCKTLNDSFGCKYYSIMEWTEISKGNVPLIKL
jgi:hypothetical protein